MSAVCIRPGCERPAWKPGGFCGRSCRDAGPAAQPPAEVRCRRPNCNRPAYEGKPGNFCGRSCMRAGPPDQPSQEEPDSLSLADDGKPFEAWHGTSKAFAEAIKQDKFMLSECGNLGKGAYFAGREKASRFALEKYPDAPALVKCSVLVKKPKYVTGDCTAWQAEGYDGCRAESTSLSPRPEWCVASPGQITVLEVIPLA